MLCFSNLFWYKSTCFRQVYCPSSGVYYCIHSNSQHNLYDKYLLLCIQYQTPDDGQSTCLKRVEFYTKINLRNSAFRWFFYKNIS
jgi:hypothetical protein